MLKVTHAMGAGFRAACAVLCTVCVCAEAQVRVVKPLAGKTVLDVTGLRVGAGGAEFQAVLCADLRASGWFRLSGQQPEFRLVGSVSVRGGKLEVECQVLETHAQRYRLSKRYADAPGSGRALAHAVCDDIVSKLTGRAGIASSRIALIGKKGVRRELYVCDADGSNLAPITKDNVICLSPNWGPQGRRIVYTSFIAQFPDVYLIDLERGNRRCVANYPGLNTTADFSPDGRSVALTLSKDGNPELYVKTLSSGTLRRLTRTRNAAEVSPSWSPDGRQLVYVSDAPGMPQLYVIPARGGRGRRLTARGAENVSPDWGENGLIAYSSRRDRRYQICIVDPEKRTERQLTDGTDDYEDPSWAPDGRHLVCACTRNFHSDLYILDTMGDPPLRLTAIRGEWMAPAWSPK